MSEASETPPKRRPRGRPTKYTDDLGKAIIKTLTLGNYFDVACENAGVGVATGYRWLDKHRNFREAVTKAQAEAEVFLLAGVNSAGANWQAKAWMLERKFPGRWGQRVQASVRSELNEFLDHLQRGLGAEEFRRVLQVAAARYADLEAGPTPQAALTSGGVIDGELAGVEGGATTTTAHSGADGVHPRGKPPPDGPASPGSAGGGHREE